MKSYPIVIFGILLFCFSEIKADPSLAVLPVCNDEFHILIRNDQQISDRIFEFDLYITDLNQNQPFELASVQLGISLNPAIVNSGSISCFIKNNSSQLNISQRPNTVTYSSTDHLIQLHPRPVPAAGSGTIIGDTLNPTRICRLRIANTVPWATAQANLAFVFSGTTFPTTLSYFSSGNIIPLNCDVSNCFSEANNPVLNPTTLYPPEPFMVLGGGVYCEEDFPVNIGLSNSQTGVVYQLFRNGIFTGSLEGSGSPIGWDCSETGTYTISGTNAAGQVMMSGEAVISNLPTPSAFIFNSATTVCQGDPVTLEAQITDPGTAAVYEWWISRPGGPVVMSTSTPALTYVPEVGDSPGLIYITTEPCNFQVESNVLTLNIIPTATGGQVSGSKSVYLGQSTGNLTLSGFSGSVIFWQKQHNNAGWQEITSSADTYSEVPSATGTWKYRAIVGRSNCRPDTSLPAIIQVDNRILSLKILPEGLFNPLTGILNHARDTQGPHFDNETADLITVRLIEPQIPYIAIANFPDLPLPLDGIINIPLAPSLTSSCYLAINHRNSLETWSSEPVDLNANYVTYNFTTGAEKAYGFNQIESGNQWLMIGGDVNQDGLINQADITVIENAAENFQTGYRNEDNNGDAVIDAEDLLLSDNHAANGYSALHPYSQEMPLIITYPARNISINSALLGGEVISQGASPVSAKGICWSFLNNPTINDSIYSDEEGTGLTEALISGLETGKHYYFRAFAINLSGIFYGPEYSFTTLSEGGTPPPLGIPTVTYGYQTYNTVQLGDQIWMRENLNIGLLVGTSQPQTNNGIIEKYCLTDETGYCSTYGGLYQWDEMMQYSTNPSARGICPPGWHLPSDSEWQTLTNFLGGSAIAGGKLKDSFTRRWNDPNEGATNESGFSALPGGNSFGLSGNIGFWFTSSICAPGSAMSRALHYNSASVEENNGCPKKNMSFAMSVRCLMDDSLKMPSVSTTAVRALNDGSVEVFGTAFSNGGTDIIVRGCCWDTIPTPGINNPHTNEGNGSGSFSSSVSGLIAGKTYYFRMYATNSAGTSYGNEKSYVAENQAPSCPGLDSLVIDDQVYHTVMIGNQCWMKENLNRGTQVQMFGKEPDSGIQKVCYQNNPLNCDIYGGLYSWDEAMMYSDTTIRGICPEGWHIPTISDWNILANTLGGNALAGAKMKVAGTSVWNYPNNSDNSSGFSAFPGGQFDIGFALMNYWGGFWSSETDHQFTSLYYTSDELGFFQGFSQYLSVRCIQDDTIGDPVIQTTAIGNITQNTAECGGAIIFNGGYPVISKGVCYGPYPNPAIWGTHTEEGSGSGPFLSILTGLYPDSLYYARAYFTNAAGTFYGQDISFTTSGENQPPNIRTGKTLSVHSEGAIINGEVLAQGSFPVTQRGICWSIHENPTIGNNYSEAGSGTGTFTVILENLHPNSAYYTRAFAISSLGVFYGDNVGFYTYTGPCPEEPTITVDTQVYHTVQIGNQCWMKENLNLGERIDHAILPQNNSLVEKYCYQDQEENCIQYGALYRWDEAMAYQPTEGGRGICPEGWHIPGQADYDTLIDYLGGNSTAGGKLKEAGYQFWEYPNEEASDLYGFSARGSGLYFSPNQLFLEQGRYAYFWSSSGYEGMVTTLNLYHNYPDAGFTYNTVADAYSVRCLRNTTANLITGSVSNITNNAVTINGSIAYGNGFPVLERGFCWSTETQPDLEDWHNSEGSGFGTFSMEITGLDPASTYYIRSYAINSNGTIYGNEVIVTTLQE